MRPWVVAGLAGCSFSVPLEDVRSDDSAGADIYFEDGILRDVDPDSGAGDAPPCGLTGLVLLPSVDATAAYYRDPLRVRLSEPDPSVRFVLRTAAGAALDGTAVARPDDPATIEFHPNEPLVPSTEYRVTVGFCDDTETLSWSFTTSGAGQPLTAELTGRAYQLDLEGARWMRPAGIGGLVPLVSEHNVLVGVETVSGTDLHGIVAPGVAGAQDHCGLTSSLPAAVLNDSWLSLPETTVLLSISGNSIVLDGAVVTGDFLADGSAFVGGRVAGTVDFRQLVDVLPSSGLGSTAEELCAFVETYGSSCRPCADGVEVCYDLEVEGITAQEVDGPLSCVALDDCHPSCAASTCADPAAGECSV